MIPIYFKNVLNVKISGLNIKRENIFKYTNPKSNNIENMKYNIKYRTLLSV